MIHLLDALKARIPLIRLANNDPVNLTAQLQDLSAAARFTGTDEVTVLEGNQLASKNNYLHICSLDVAIDRSHYNSLMATGSTLILVGAADPNPMVLDLGAYYPTQKDLVLGLQRNAQASEPLAQSMSASLRGLTVLQATAIGKVVMAHARDNGVPVTHDMLAQCRAAMVGQTTGLELISREQSFYSPSPELAAWVQWAITATANTKHYRLRPRGVLLHGLPGTGKTSAALYVATVFNRPLVRMDIAAMLTRWQGEAEQFLRMALQAIEMLSPAIMLIDEVEKVLNRNAGDDTTRRITSQMLWWLASHTSQVIVIMTANDKSALPPELIRDGRLDEVIEVKELPDLNALASFVNGVAGSYAGMINPHSIDYGHPPFNQSRVTRLIEKAVSVSGK